VKEFGLCKKSSRTLVRVDPRYFRPTEVEMLLGNPAKARSKLGWKHQIGFQELVSEMIANDLKLISERPDGGLKIDRS
jgi:GDPmannose 4,6-dehydratase